MTDKLTDEEIIEGLKLAEKATPGPWYWEWGFTNKSGTKGFMLGGHPVQKEEYVSIPCVLDGAIQDDWNDTGVVRSEEDGEFIAASRTFLPKALKELQELREICLNQTGEILNLQASAEKAEAIIEKLIDARDKAQADRERLVGALEKARVYYWARSYDGKHNQETLTVAEFDRFVDATLKDVGESE